MLRTEMGEALKQPIPIACKLIYDAWVETRKAYNFSTASYDEWLVYKAWTHGIADQRPLEEIVFNKAKENFEFEQSHYKNF